ncbi:MAG: hypothetical protein LBR81_03560 [Prevotellaceae bacterium]|nr:hypothetical protein [Prevotellaceae bacterium]
MIIKSVRLASFTLIEAVVAMIIVLACFWLSGMIYINLLRTDARGEKLRAFTETKRIAIESKQQRSYFDEEIMIDSALFVTKTIGTYRDNAELKVLHLETFNKTKRKLASYKQIIIAE